MPHDDGNSFLTEKTWCELVAIVKPRVTHDEAMFMFAIMDTNNDQKISQLEFMANATVAMRLDFTQLRRDMKTSQEKVLQHHNRNKFIIFGARYRPAIKKLMRHPNFDKVCIGNAICHTAIVCLGEFPMRNTSTFLCNCGLGVSVLEMALKFTAYPDLYVWKVSERARASHN